MSVDFGITPVTDSFHSSEMWSASYFANYNERDNVEPQLMDLMPTVGNSFGQFPNFRRMKIFLLTEATICVLLGEGLLWFAFVMCTCRVDSGGSVFAFTGTFSKSSS